MNDESFKSWVHWIFAILMFISSMLAFSLYVKSLPEFIQ